MKSTYIYTLFLFILCATISQAQPLNKATTLSLIQAGDEAYEAEDYYNAVTKYKEAYEEDNSVYLAHRIAVSSFKLKDYIRAERYYSRLIKKDRKKKKYIKDVRYEYAQSLKMNEKYDEAIEQYKLVIEETEDQKMKDLAQLGIDGADLAKDLVETLGLKVKHGGKNINSKTSEYAPIYDNTGETMYFSAMEADDVVILDGTEEDYFMKIFQAKKKGEKWGKPEVLNYLINREDYHTGNPALSPDGQRMYFTRAQLDGNYVTESKIYVSTNGADGWGAANELVGINGDYLSKHPIVGELFGREVIYFTSDMDGGYGGDDIYYATRKGDGVYADPVNLGPKINTSGDEATPFYFDGELYFSSTGHPGIGGFDIFKSTWDGTGWSLAANMGQGYNSPVDDLYYRLDQDGEKGLLVSNRVGEGSRSAFGKTCCNDIYTFEVAKIAAGLVAASLDGKNPVAGVDFQLIDLSERRPDETQAKNSGQGNKVAFELVGDKRYRVIATKEGYYPDTIEVKTFGLLETKQFEAILNLKPIPKPAEPEEPLYETYTIDEPIELRNIFYQFDSAEFVEGAEDDLQLIFDLMNQYPEMKIELYSHTDARGKDKYNMDLSQRRASAAKRWLVQKGIEVTRIRAIGKGETEIRNRCQNRVKCDEEEHLFNRRTEFKIVEGPTTIQIEKKKLLKKG